MSIRDQERLFKETGIVVAGMEVLELTGLIVTENESKRDIQPEHSGLVLEDRVYVLDQIIRVQGIDSKIIPVLDFVTTTESSTDLGPVFSVNFSRRLVNI